MCYSWVSCVNITVRRPQSCRYALWNALPLVYQISGTINGSMGLLYSYHWGFSTHVHRVFKRTCPIWLNTYFGEMFSTGIVAYNNAFVDHSTCVNLIFVQFWISRDFSITQSGPNWKLKTLLPFTSLIKMTMLWRHACCFVVPPCCNKAAIGAPTYMTMT